MNSCTYVAPILNIVLSEKIDVSYSTSLFEVKNHNHIDFSIISLEGVTMTHMIHEPFLLYESL